MCVANELSHWVDGWMDIRSTPDPAVYIIAGECKTVRAIASQSVSHLSGVSPEGWCPSLGQTPHALLFHADLEAGDKVLVLRLVDLESALDQIQRHDHCVRQSAGQSAT